jgi:beta-glucanase (GH16 family)
MKYLLPLFLFAIVLNAADPSTGRSLVFSDDFNAGKLDESKWRITGSADAISFAKAGKEGVVRIGLKMGADMIQTNTITSKGKFSQQYGYFVASMRLNASEGHSGTFRIATDEEKTAPSITIAFHATGKDRVTPWGRGLTDSGQQDYRPEKPVSQMKSGDLSKKFHTYGLLWTESAFTWYIDGKVVHKLERKEFTRPMNVSMTHRVLEEERQKLNLKSLPDDIDIDWVKVWK